ncbi:MAG: hypothetical protein IJY94_00715 [Clostridia bacterium]|nr:hypothetical protein [Clostridia bacterium]
MDILFEFLIEIYMELMMLVVPEENRTKKRYRVPAIIIALIGIAATIASLVYGLHLVIDKDDLLGIIPIAIAALLSLAQITAGIVIRISKKGK